MIQHLRKLYDTLFGRTAVVLAITLVLAHSLPIVIYRLEHPQHHATTPDREPIAARWITEAESRRAIYDALPPTDRQNYLRASDQGPERLQLTEPEGFTPLSGPDAERLQQTVQARLGPGSLLGHVAGPPHSQWLRFSLAGQMVWLMLPGPSLIRPEVNIEPLIWITGSIALLGLMATLTLLWPLYHPLRQLAAAQEALGRGESVAPLPDSGPRELARLSASFNRMVSDLDALELERRTLLAGVSHDLRTPLARLRMRLALLDDVDHTPFERDIDDIERITEQFLAYVRGQADEGQREDIELAVLIRELVDRYAASAGIVMNITASPRLSADALALRRALANLIDNGLTHGCAPIEVSLSQVGNEAIIAVRDHGEGVAPDTLPSARRPFHRLDPARGGHGHCGLGLAIVERIATHHGGRLELANHPEGGLVAALHLPIDNISRS